ncbi:AAA family ATPase [Bacillus toyonensis]|uniref:AAA family ATPase n=1 Tax=Bacillus toyonensis TaxID=155322 RepID=UPI0018A138C7|nr:AAA family ATPase [Bacillus toyonensis]MBF7145192.1 AAA family ATPase [Bacillus toyonensis]MEC2348771.1 AAA family ATPase [Bacillus toyonensis]MED3185048.1 AAA family ATPase [Bacillus toyonensis]
MKILYFWFKEYKRLNDFEANLGSEFIFHFDENKLIIDENKVFIENFFSLTSKKDSHDLNSMNISTIVGENGSGKSTVLDFLAELMNKGVIESDYILVYSVKGKLHISFVLDSEITIVNKTSKVIYFCNSPLNLQKHLTLLFSNVFDARSMGMLSEDETVHYQNISTNFLISRYREISYFLRDEFEKQIFFIHEYKEKINIQNLMKIPDKIFIKVSLNEAIIPYTDDLEGILLYLRNDMIAVDYFDHPAPNNFYVSFYSNCLKAFFIHIDLLIRKYNVEDILDYEYKELLFHYSQNDYYNIFNGIYEQIKEDADDRYDVRDNKNMRKRVKENVNPFLKDLFELKGNFENVYEYFIKVNFGYLNEIPFMWTDFYETSEFITLYQKAFAKIGCLEFTWSDMSSGEYGMLSLFSRFHAVLKDLKEDHKLLSEDENLNSKELPFVIRDGELKFEENSITFPTSYLLLIDEGDLYFHPQWQKDWLYYFIRLSKLLFKGEVQIILTTHSPFVLSDFPNTNVVFLRNNDQASVSATVLDGSPKTFASNIIELFSNSFFIKDGLIGSFAKEKINLFIQRLLKLSPEEVYLHREGIKRFIDTIGEPLIRNKILQIYHGKLELHNDFDIGRRILLLEQELQNLKAKRKL